MNAVKSSLIFSAFVLVSSFIVSVAEARDPFNALMSRNIVGRKVPDFFDIGLYLGAIKGSGPSGGGEGHRFVNGQTLGGIKNSGPSNGGEGHKFTDSRTLGGIKNSGPSPGEGHSSTLGGIKDSGPSPGVGNKFTDSRTRTHGVVKDSGPSPGVGN